MGFLLVARLNRTPDRNGWVDYGNTERLSGVVHG